MDNMAAGWNRPQEDEFAVLALGAPTPYSRMAFPNDPAEYSALLMQITEGKCYSVGEMRACLNQTGFDARKYQDTAVARGSILAERL